MLTITLDPHSEKFIAEQLGAGHYPSAEEIIRSGLRLVEERAHKLAALRQEIDEVIAEDEWYSFEEVLNYVENHALRESLS